MSMIGNIAVEAATNEILDKIDSMNTLSADAQAALDEVREFVAGINQTAKAGYY